MLVVVVAIFAAAIAVERIIRIQFQYSIDSRAFMAKLKKYILSDNIDRAIKKGTGELGGAADRTMQAIAPLLPAGSGVGPRHKTAAPRPANAPASAAAAGRRPGSDSVTTPRRSSWTLPLLSV